VKEQIINYLQANPASSSTQTAEQFTSEASYATVKRILKQLVEEGLIAVTGKARAARYTISRQYQFIHPINQNDYFLVEQDARKIKQGFNFSILHELLAGVSLFTAEELHFLHELNTNWIDKLSQMSADQKWKSFERWAVDLSWKSSQIEGNTYSLLETERLLLEKRTAEGKTQDEATMLLNHKVAIDFILAHPEYVQPLTRSAIEDVHSLLIKDLQIERNIRSYGVAITGTNYRPLDNVFQIKEALELLCVVANKQAHFFEKAFLLLIMIAYIQPFEDGNKRTARILSNAILLQYGSCPLSYRTLDPLDYKKAMLIFYEQNNVSVFKKIFMDQFAFAVNEYAI
jgi:Fic family protein